MRKAAELNYIKLITLAHIPLKPLRKDINQVLTKAQKTSFFKEIKFFEEQGFHQALFNPIFMEKDLI